jgi:SAM-dependent methyltransferase
VADVLNLGAGNKLMAGAVNHDIIKHRKEIDVTHDLNVMPWPWKDDSFDLINACSVFEHLRVNLAEVMNECWRILRPGGTVRIKVPWCKSEMAFSDPTHYWQFSIRTFDFFDPDTRLGKDYGFYGWRRWHIAQRARLNKEKTSIVCVLRVRK